MANEDKKNVIESGAADAVTESNAQQMAGDAAKKEEQSKPTAKAQDKGRETKDTPFNYPSIQACISGQPDRKRCWLYR